jgi:hypothetical protein
MLTEALPPSPSKCPYHPLITTLTKTQRICTDLEIVFFGPPGGTHTQPTPYRLFLGQVKGLGDTRSPDITMGQDCVTAYKRGAMGRAMWCVPTNMHHECHE